MHIVIGLIAIIVGLLITAIGGVMRVLYCIHPAKKGDKPQFRRIGVGFDNQDGSVNILMDNQPGVTFQLREVKEKED